MYQIAEIDQDWKNAFKFLSIHNKFLDSLEVSETREYATMQAAKMEYENEKILQSKEYEKKIAIEREQNARQAQTIYFTLGSAVMLVFFVVFALRRLRLTRRQKEMITEQKESLQETHNILATKNEEITSSIQYAKRIQDAILPSPRIMEEELPEHFVFYRPKDIVAGDFFWLEKRRGKTFLAVADCTGHGVPGAMVSVICNNGLNRSVREFDIDRPAEILNKTRELVLQEFAKSEQKMNDGMDIALCAFEGSELVFAGAHNPLWVYRSATKEIEEWKANKQPIGQFEQSTEFTEHVITISKGDTIFMFSDGYPDQFGGPMGKKLKKSGLKNLILEHVHLPMKDLNIHLSQFFEDWMGDGEQIDDVCVIGVRF